MVTEAERRDSERWLLSFYRTSEISGALFFGRLARSLKAGPVQWDMTKHFADESQHAWYWSRCLSELGHDVIKLEHAYQDQYLGAAGMPVNLMEILAITHVFERRVAVQYGAHRKVPGLSPVLARTIDTIMVDEAWHLKWVGAALKTLEGDYGADAVAATLRRCEEADRLVYERTLEEHRERTRVLFALAPSSAPLSSPLESA